MSVKLKIINLSGQLLWGPETLPTSLLGLIGLISLMGLIGLGPRPSPNASTYAAHIFHILLGASFSASVGVSIPIPKPQSGEYSPNPELSRTGEYRQYHPIFFRDLPCILGAQGGSGSCPANISISRLSCDELRKRVAQALDVFVFRVALAKGETPLEGPGSLASMGLTCGEVDVQVVLG